MEEEVPSFPDEADWWDEYEKPASISFCKSFSSSLAKQRKTYKKFLFSVLRLATVKKDWKLVSQTKEKLKSILRFELDGLKVRSRQGQNAEEEVASMYHQKKVKKSDILKLKVKSAGPEGEQGNMEVTEDPVRMEESPTNFFDALLNGRLNKNLEDTGVQFQPDYTHLDDFLSNLSSLSPASQTALEKDLSIEELEWIMKTCPYGRAPGLDGLTYEFYRATWSVIGKSFHQVLQVQMARSRIMDSGREGATRLIPKVDGIPEINDLRPITLLQVDYRILSKVLDSMLSLVK